MIRYWWLWQQKFVAAGETMMKRFCLKTVSKRLIIDIMILNMHGNVCWIPQGIQLLYL